MGQNASTADDERGTYRPPAVGEWTQSSASPNVVLAAIRIQKVVRGRQTRQQDGFMRAWSNFTRGVGDAGRRAVASAQASTLGLVLDKADGALQSTYVGTLKPTLTPCPATPSVMRFSMHLLGDRMWDSTHVSLVESIGDFLADKFLPPPPAPHESQPRRAIYAFAGESWRRASWPQRGRMVLMRARARLLYAYSPYDQTFWLKLGSYDALLLMVLATIPLTHVRTTLYSAILVAITLPWHDATALQYMQFILLFKGSQFFSGLILGLSEMWHLWKCFVLAHPQTCGADEPGGSKGSIADQVVNLLISQGLVAAALYLAHRASSSFSIMGLLGKQAARLDAMWTRWVLGVAWLLGAMANTDSREEEEDLGLPLLLNQLQEARALRAAEDGGGDEEEQGGGGNDDEFRGGGRRQRGRSVHEDALCVDCLDALPSWAQPLVGAIVRAGGSLLHCRRSFGRWVRALPAVERAVARATARRARADLQDAADEAAHEDDDDAMQLDIFSSVFFWLLIWDSAACFLFISALFGSIDGQGTGYGWRARQSFVVLHALFMMSALPFVPFFLAAKVGATVGMGPNTAFNRHGLCVPVNTTGLSAYCIWVKRLLKRWSVRRVLPVAERKAIREEASRLHNYTEIYPYAMRAQSQRRAELHARLESALRAALTAQGYEQPETHGVYRECFPTEVQVAAYVRRTAKRVEAERKTRVAAFVEKVRVNGVGEAARS